MATPRSKSACTLGSQEVGKLNLPSFSSCWPNALQLIATVISPATNSLHFSFIDVLPIANGRQSLARGKHVGTAVAKHLLRVKARRRHARCPEVGGWHIRWQHCSQARPLSRCAKGVDVQ